MKSNQQRAARMVVAANCGLSILALLALVRFDRSHAFAQEARSAVRTIEFPIVGPIRGSEDLLKSKGTILVGEMHGTWESPLLVASLVRSALSKEAPTILCLELESSEQKSLDQFLRSDGGMNAVAALLKSRHWSNTDGRASNGMFAMIELMRRLIKQGNDVRLIAIDLDMPNILPENVDPKDIDPKLIEEYRRLSEKRDQVMAENVVAARNKFPMSHVFVLTGNIHTKFTKGLPWDGEYKPMGWYIQEQIPNTVCLDFQCSGGRAWQATDQGVVPVTLNTIEQAKDIAMEATYDVGFLHEPEGMVQASHLQEHLVCYSPCEGFADREAMNFLNRVGSANAETLPAFTHYDYAVPSEHFEKVVMIEANRMQQFSFSQAVMEREAKRCYKETDFVEANASAGMLKHAFMACSHAWRFQSTRALVRGGMEAFSSERLKAFHSQYYNPSHLTIAIQCCSYSTLLNAGRA